MNTRRALFHSYLEKYAAIAIGLITSMLLARLLTPAEIGLFSIGAVLAGFAGTVRDLGTGTYVVQVPDLTDSDVRACFGIALITGAIFAALLLLISVPVARFYGAAGIREVVWIFAATFLIIPFSSVTQAVLSRQMRFGILAWIRTAATATNGIVAILLAYYGFGYMSLAWAVLASSLCTASLTIVFRPADSLLLPSLRGSRRILSFGTPVSVGNMFMDLAQGAPELVLGKLQSLDSTAYYSKASSLIALFHNFVVRASWQVALPFFAERHRSGELLREHYVDATVLLTGLGWPFFAFLAMNAEPVVRILYGSQWDSVVPLVPLLAASASVALLFSMSVQVLPALGATRILLRVQLFSFLVTVSIALSGAYLGLYQMTFLLMVAAIPLGLLQHAALKRVIEISMSDYWAIIRFSAPLAISALGASLLAKVVSHSLLLSPILQIALAAALSAPCVLLAARWRKHPLFLEIAKLLKLRS